MMEESEICVCQDDSVLVACLNNSSIVGGSRRAADEADAALEN